MGINVIPINYKVEEAVDYYKPTGMDLALPPYHLILFKIGVGMAGLVVALFILSLLLASLRLKSYSVICLCLGNIVLAISGLYAILLFLGFILWTMGV